MTAEVVPIPAPDNDRTDETIRRTVKGLIRGRGLRVEDVAPAVGMATTTFYRRLAGKGQQQAFAAGEVSRLASYFELEIMDLYTGLGGKFAPGGAPAQRDNRPSITRKPADRGAIVLPFPSRHAA